MTFLEHLAELRKRIIYSTIFILITSIFCFILFEQIISFILWFYKNGSSDKNAKLAVLGVVDAFMVRIKVSTYCGIIISFPFWLWQIWAFINSALTKKEKKLTAYFIFVSVVLFFMGIIIGFITLPKAIEFLINVGGKDFTQILVADKYINFVLLMSFAFGLSFEMPVVLVFLMLTNIVSPSWFKGKRRVMLLCIIVFAAIITPSQDPYSLLLMALPLYLLFEISIVIGSISKRKAK